MILDVPFANKPTSETAAPASHPEVEKLNFAGIGNSYSSVLLHFTLVSLLRFSLKRENRSFAFVAIHVCDSLLRAAKYIPQKYIFSPPTPPPLCPFPLDDSDR